MRVVLVGTHPSLVEALGRAGMEVGQVQFPPAGDAGATAGLAGALRAADEALAGDPPDALLVGGDGDPALGAALTAVKLGIPTAWLRPADAPRDALVGRVADLSLDATTDAEVLATAVRELAAPTISAR